MHRTKWGRRDERTGAIGFRGRHWVCVTVQNVVFFRGCQDEYDDLNDTVLPEKSNRSNHSRRSGAAFKTLHFPDEYDELNVWSCARWETLVRFCSLAPCGFGSPCAGPGNETAPGSGPRQNHWWAMRDSARGCAARAPLGGLRPPSRARCSKARRAFSRRGRPAGSSPRARGPKMKGPRGCEVVVSAGGR